MAGALLIAALALALADPPAAQGPSADDLARRAIERRAVEATIWGMPAVSMAAIRASLKRDLDADFGDVIYFSNVMEPRRELLTANNQNAYVFTFFDLRRGPMVLDVPPATDKVALFGSGIDSWQVPLVDVGPTGDDAGKGGRYLFFPSGYSGERPQRYFVVESPTNFIHFALRPIASGKGTLQDAVAYSQRLKAYPLADAASLKPNRYIDAYPRTWKTLPVFDVTYFRLLAGVIDADPPQAKDAAMLGMLKSLGIEKREAVPPRRAAGTAPHERGARSVFVHVGLLRAQGQCAVVARPAVAVAKLREQLRLHVLRGWDSRLRAPGRRLLLLRDVGAETPGDPGKLPESYYLYGFRDKAGNFFKGDRLYRLRIPADTPAHDFWSIVVYKVGTNAFIDTAEKRVGLSSYDKSKMTANKDGSVDLYIGPKPPAGLAQNWIPTAGKPFWIAARFYGPEKPLFDKTWVMADVEEVK